MGDQSSLFSLNVISPIGEEGLVSARKKCKECERCPLAKSRTQVVFGEGNSNEPDVLFVGEAPGSKEDELGSPFVGRSGQFLLRIVKAMGYERGDIYLCNAVGCRPPDNRPPEKSEIDACEEYLSAQIRAVRPKIIVALGGTAARALMGGKKKISEVRGKWHLYKNDIPIMPTLHPSAVVRAERDPEFVNVKRLVWGDMQLVLARLGKYNDSTKKGPS